MSHEPSLRKIQGEYHGSLRSYIIGFSASVLLTMVSFGLVLSKKFGGRSLVYALVALALLQAMFQLRYFLKLGHEERPRWETLTFLFMFFILVVIAIGSLWVMSDLDARMMMDM